MIDYDTTPANLEPEQAESPLVLVNTGRRGLIDLDDGTESPELAWEPLAGDLSGESLGIQLIPQQADEFTCTRCYLVHHLSQLADPGCRVCRDCSG